MEKKFRRAYIDYDNFTDDYVLAITKVTQSDEFGKFEDIDEDEIVRYGEFASIDEAKDFLKKNYRVKELYINDIKAEL